MMHRYLQVAIVAARHAGHLIKENLGRAKEVSYKGGVDLVTEIDRKSEELIAEYLAKTFPDHGFLSEEGTNRTTSSESVWVVDPLDGTTNFAHGFPAASVSVALQIKEDVVLGVVYNPFLEELFHALKGQGAYLNDLSIRVSRTEKLEHSLLATGTPYNIREEPEPALGILRDFILHAQGIRRAGVASLDICYVAIGRFDGFWELGLHPWDTAAGSLILKEAGGQITDLRGGSFSIYKPEIVASNGLVHNEMLGLISPRLPVFNPAPRHGS